MTVSGLAGGGPDGLLPGDYVLLLVYGEVDDTRSFIPGTDDEPTKGFLNTTIACEGTATVTEGADVLVIAATFGPVCAIEAASR